MKVTDHGGYISVDRDEALRKNWPTIQKILGGKVTDKERLDKIRNADPISLCSEYDSNAISAVKLVSYINFLLAQLDKAHAALRICQNTVGFVPDGQSTQRCIKAINEALGEE